MKNRKIGYVKKLDDNKYLLRLSAGYDDFGKRVQPSRVVNCKNEKEAEIALMKFYSEKDKIKEQMFSSAPVTLGELYKEFLKNHCELKLQPRSIEYYKDLWRLHIEKRAEKAKLKTFSPKMIYEILHNVKGDRTRQGVYVLLKLMFNKAILWGYMESNPCSKVESPKYHAKEKNIYEKTDLTEVLKPLVNEPLKYQAIFYFAILCGLRRSEIIGLSWRDIDFTKMQFSVNKAATSLKKIGTFIKDETKNKSSNRALKLPEILSPILKQMRIEQLETKLKLQNLWHDNDYIFTQHYGKLMNVDTPTRWWGTFLKANPQLPKITFHSLRHSLASNMLQNGASLADVSAVLGHAQKSTTLNTYSHAIKDSKTQALIDIENVLLNNNVQ